MTLLTSQIYPQTVGIFLGANPRAILGSVDGVA